MADITLERIGSDTVLKERVYGALREAIANMDIYATPEPAKLDERKLAEELGVSRTPVREALSRLEQENLVRNVPRRGTFVVRKTKKEIIEIVQVWAALESMAARLATRNASDEEIGRLRAMFATFIDGDEARVHIDEYSDRNIAFHQSIMALGKCDLLCRTADSLFVHMRALRRKAIKENDRATRSVIDHMRIIEALEQRNAKRAETIVREHALSLARHIDRYADHLE